ncbi:MAG: type III secretion system inner rod subunit SctI [Pseudomonadota bacterium]
MSMTIAATLAPDLATSSVTPAQANTPVELNDRVERFRQIFDQAVEAERAAEGPTAPERQRTIDTLGLDAVAADVRTGDSILSGLSALRGVFDAQQARITEVVAADTIGGTAAASATLMAAQFELVQYTMLVDVTSKLTGKATQSLDTLIKGQ